MSPVETCGLAACLVEWEPKGDLSGTRTGAVGPTEHSVQGWVRHVVVEAGFRSGYWRVVADALHQSDGRKTVEHRCPVVVPEVHLPVQEIEGLLVVQGLVGEDPHLDRSSFHPVAWSTLAVQGMVSWPG